MLTDIKDGTYIVKDGVVYEIVPKIVIPFAKSINMITGEIRYPTNADRVRQMADEELAGLLAEMCEVTCANLIECDGKCEEHALEWLKREAAT